MMDFTPSRTMDGAVLRPLGSGYVYVTGYDNDRYRLGNEPGSVYLAFAYPTDDDPEPTSRVLFMPDSGLNRMEFEIGFEPVFYWVIRMLDDNTQAARTLLPREGLIRNCTLTIDLRDHLALMR